MCKLLMEEEKKIEQSTVTDQRQWTQTETQEIPLKKKLFLSFFTVGIDKS